MQDLSTIARGIKIGNMAASTLANMAAGLNFGRGLFHDTTLMGIRRANMINNYHYTSSYYNIKSKVQPTESKRFFFDRLLDAPNIDGLEIGWGYSTDINNHTLNIGFASSKDFDEFQNLLRDRSLYHGRQNSEYKELYKDFSVNFISNNSYNGGELNKGDKIVLDFNYKQPKRLKLITNLIELLNTDKIPDDRYKPIKNYFNSLKSYAVDISTNEIELYSVNELNKQPDEIIINKDNKGILRYYNNSNNNVINYQYQELDKGEIKSSFDGVNMTDNNTVYIPSFDSASKLLRKTNELFRNGKIKSMINRFHGEQEISDELTTAFSEEYGFSRGRNLLRKNPRNDNYKNSSYDNPYCRTWTAHHQYAKLKDRIRPFITDDDNFMSIEETQRLLGDLRPNNGSKRLNDLSVLQDNGFIKMSPTHNHIEEKDLKRYMFSIENLAWKDSNNTLSKEQKGPNGGRIMWFPPYNLKFSENINVNWTPNNFIGRGEQIFTYTNTERSGTLDFTILIDHPSSINKWRGKSSDIKDKEIKEQDILRYFAGCGQLDEEVVPEVDIITDGELSNNLDTNKKPKTYIKDIAYIIFFPNDFSGNDYIKNIDDAIERLKTYEYSKTDKNFSERDKKYEKEILQVHNINNINSGKLLNNFSKNEETIEFIRNEVFNGNKNIEIKSFNDLLDINKENTGDLLYGLNNNTCKVESIEYKGFASSHGILKNNNNLANNRAELIKSIIENKCDWIDINEVTSNFLSNTIKEMPNDGGRNDVNSITAKVARAAIAVLHIAWNDEVKTYNTPSNEGIISSNGIKLLNNENKDKENKSESNLVVKQEQKKPEENLYSYDNEYLYFSEITSSEHNFIYNHIVDKVRFFDPAFHSITPEGFNSRLTFLQQCTRQGPTVGIKTDIETNNYLKYAGNLAFGRAPYCILRIGDFFYTKICIESISIQYDNNGVQWDLNPEGVGVQPMYATVSMNFKFLGGQDISGPIEKLQNAVTSNYYANASIYDKNADFNK